MPVSIDIIKLEEISANLLSEARNENYSFSQIIKLNNFIKELLNYNNRNIIEAFFSELINYLSLNLSFYSPIGINIEFTNEILSTCKRLKRQDIFKNNSTEIDSEITRIENEKQLIYNSLNGNINRKLNIFSFPIIIQNGLNTLNYGMIENINVRIKENKTISNDEIYIIPGSNNPKSQLNKQIFNSWYYALSFINNTKFKSKHYELYVKFKYLDSTYVGESFGAALTIYFINEFYNINVSKFSINPLFNISITGGMNEFGKIYPVGETIIINKVETVFYSDQDILILPIYDFESAQKKLNNLNIIYPNRKLKLYGIKYFEDLFSLKNVISLKKKPFTHRLKNALQFKKLKKYYSPCYWPFHLINHFHNKIIPTNYPNILSPTNIRRLNE